MMQPPQGPHYGHMYAPPQAPGAMGYGYGYGYGWSPARAAGELLDYPVQGAQLPPVCCKCGTEHGLKTRFATMVWVNPLAWLGLLGGLLPLALMMAFMQKRCQVMLPICQPCDTRWTHGTIFRWLSFLAPFVLGPIIGALIGLFVEGDAAFGIGILVCFVLLLAMPLATVKLVSEPRAVIAKRIDDHRAMLKGVHPEMLRRVG
jgi:hypothetical protein